MVSAPGCSRKHEPWKRLRNSSQLSEIAGQSPDGRHIASHGQRSPVICPGNGRMVRPGRNCMWWVRMVKAQPFHHRSGQYRLDQLATGSRPPSLSLPSAGEDEHAQLHLIPVRGGESRRLAELPGGISGYSFHPDGHPRRADRYPSSRMRMNGSWLTGVLIRSFMKKAC